MSAVRYSENVATFKYLGTTVTKIKIVFTKKLRADQIRGMFDTILFRVFASPL
jgi:hypothetical protein